jgi:hypothetical protein
MITGERLLWQAVLDTALSDALSVRHAPGLLRRRMNWFREDNPDFQMVCNLADSDPETVRNLLITLLKNGDEYDIKTFTRSTKHTTQCDKRKNTRKRRTQAEKVKKELIKGKKSKKRVKKS